MTLSSTVTRVEFTGNGSTTAFAFNYPVLAAADLTVTLVNAAGSATTQTLDSHYTVALASDLTSATVNMSSAPTGGGTPDKLVIEREVDLTQIDDFQENEALPSADLEKALDKLTMATQQLNTDIARSVRLPVGDTSGLATELGVSTAADRENKLLGFNAAGNALVEVAGRVVSVSVTTSGVSVGGSPTGSATFTESTGALALSLGIPVGATGATGSAGSDGVFSAIASQAEAEGGTENTKGMTALRTKQAVDSYGVISATDIGSTVQAFDADIMKSDTTKRITANMGFTPVTDSSSSNSVTFDFSTGNISKISLSENITSVTLSGATAGDILHIQITQDSSARTISGWPAAVKWSGGGTAPTISTTSGAVDIVSILYDGTNYWASVTQDHQ